MIVETIAVVPSDDSKMLAPEAGLQRQVMVFNSKMMLVRHKMIKGWVGAAHSHSHEQAVYVVSGCIIFETQNDRFEAKAGDSFIVPGGVSHQAYALEDSEVLDVFTPFREDYVPKESTG